VQYNNAGSFGGISGFTTDGTRVTASTTIGVGGATPSTSGSGITFPATQSQSSNANTLDDYEEGTFTPAISAGITTPVYGQQFGNYVKVGRLVTFSVRLLINTGVGNSAAMTFSGLPFSASNAAGGGNGSCSTGYQTMTTTPFYPFISESTSTGAFNVTASSGPTGFTTSQTFTGQYIMFGGSYFTDV
jgi:hypothetical protein